MKLKAITLMRFIIFISLMWFIFFPSSCSKILGEKDIFAQTFIFSKSIQSVKVHWQHDEWKTGGVKFRVIWSTGSVDEISDTSYVLPHSLYGDSTVIFVTAYKIPGVESGPSNKVTVLHKAVIVPPISIYLPMPYDAGFAKLRGWKPTGAVPLRPHSVLIYGPSCTPNSPGRIELRFNIEFAGQYKISGWFAGDQVNFNGLIKSIDDKSFHKIDQIVEWGKGLNMVYVFPPLRLIEVDSIHFERTGSVQAPTSPYGVGVTPI